MMITSLIGWAIKIFGGGILDKAIDAFTKSGDIRIREKEINSDTIKSIVVSYVEAQKDQNETQRAKFQIPWFWLMIASFIVPLSIWWIAIIADSIGHFGWNIANLPTVELREWASQMIAFLFYTGGAVAGFKALTR